MGTVLALVQVRDVDVEEEPKLPRQPSESTEPERPESSVLPALAEVTWCLSALLSPGSSVDRAQCLLIVYICV